MLFHVDDCKLEIEDIRARKIKRTAVHFKCGGLEAATREVLNKNEGAITRQDLAAMEELAVFGRGLTDLTGLEYAAKLTELKLDDNEITDVDVTPLTGLTELRLYHTQITLNLP